MKRAFIAAAFGGVLASGFLTGTVPAAHALPMRRRERRDPGLQGLPHSPGVDFCLHKRKA